MIYLSSHFPRLEHPWDREWLVSRKWCVSFSSWLNATENGADWTPFPATSLLLDPLCTAPEGPCVTFAIRYLTTNACTTTCYHQGIATNASGRSSVRRLTPHHSLPVVAGGLAVSWNDYWTGGHRGLLALACGRPGAPYLGFRLERAPKQG